MIWPGRETGVASVTPRPPAPKRRSHQRPTSRLVPPPDSRAPRIVGVDVSPSHQTADTSRHAQVLAGMGPESPRTHDSCCCSSTASRAALMRHSRGFRRWTWRRSMRTTNFIWPSRSSRPAREIAGSTCSNNQFTASTRTCIRPSSAVPRPGAANAAVPDLSGDREAEHRDVFPAQGRPQRVRIVVYKAVGSASSHGIWYGGAALQRVQQDAVKMRLNTALRGPGAQRQ